MGTREWSQGELVTADKMNQLAWREEVEEVDKRKADKNHKHSTSDITDFEGITEEYVGGKKIRYVTQSEYDQLTDAEKNDNTIVWNIIDATIDIPIKVSQLENDKNYATQSYVSELITQAELGGKDVDLSNYATKNDLNNYVDQTLLNDYTDGKKIRYVTQTQYDALSSSQKNDASYVWNITDAVIDLDVPTKVSQLENDSNFIDSAYVDNKKIRYVTQAQYNALSSSEKNDASYVWNITDATIDIPSKLSDLLNDQDFVNSTFVNNAINNIQIQNGVKGDKGDKGDTGATPNIQIGTVTTLSAGSNATVTRTGTNENPILNFGIPRGADGTGGTGGTGIQGEKGDTWRPYVNSNGDLSWSLNNSTTAPSTVNIKGVKGDKGDKGDKGEDGTSVKIMGTVTNTSQLPSNASAGDGYLINGDLYVYDGSNWVNVGQIKGEKGDKGDTGANGKDGLTTSITVNGQTFTHQNGSITLPSYISGDDFDLRYIAPAPHGQIMLTKTRVSQSLGINNMTGELFGGRVYNNSPEQCSICKFTENGTLIKELILTEGGHGTCFGVEPVWNNTTKHWDSYIWIGMKKDGKTWYITRFNFDAFNNGDNISTATSGVTIYDTGSTLYSICTVDSVEGNLGILRKNGDVYVSFDVYSLSDIKSGIVNRKASLSLSQNNTFLQGLAIAGDRMYHRVGNADGTEADILYVYDWKKNTFLYEINTSLVTPTRDNTVETEGFREPEGMCVYTNPQTKMKSLFICTTIMETNRRKHVLSAYHQDSGSALLGRLVGRGQHKDITAPDGTLKDIPKNCTCLADVKELGQYYLSSDEYSKLTDAPIADTSLGWFLINTGYKANSTEKDMIQIMFTNSTDSFCMYVRVNKVSGASNWRMVYGNKVPKISNVGTSLGNYKHAGTYYFTTAQMQSMTDKPTHWVSGGYFLEVSTRNNDGAYYQTLVKNGVAQTPTMYYRCCSSTTNHSPWVKFGNSSETTSDSSVLLLQENHAGNANAWLVNGHIRTNTSTSNLPSACTGDDKNGLLLFLAKDESAQTGIQIFYPTAGTNGGRVFTRVITNGSAGTWKGLAYTSEVGSSGGGTDTSAIPNYSGSDTSLASFTTAGEYYLTTAKMQSMTDLPTDWSSGGYFLEVSRPNSAGVCIQTLTKSTTGVPVIYKRVLTISSGTGTWGKVTIS